MNQKQPCQSIDDYIDDLLDPNDQTAFEAHLSSCEPCREELEIATSLDSLVQEAWAGIAAPREIRNKLPQTPKRDSKIHNQESHVSFRVSALVAAATIVLALGLMVLHMTQPNEVTQRLDSQPVKRDEPTQQRKRLLPTAPYEQVRVESESAIVETVQTGRTGFTLIHVFPSRKFPAED